ncbi:MAG: metal-dependent transcriptional regulator [Lachnospiraceae bacterium]|nr:metal-dependent transcriptional regulator [Lachnospiraceae bacterium]
MLISGKVYLSTIYRLKKQGGRVRSVELARELGYTKPSVSRAVGNFEKEGYLTVEKGGILTLTDKGLKEAKELVKRQELIAKLLQMTCGIDEKQALQDAIYMEPGASKKTLAGIRDFIRQVEQLESEQA